MNPYYQDKWVTIYHGDCRDILPQLNGVINLVLTDPPYGVNGGRGRNRARAKAFYDTATFVDTEEYIRNVCVPAFQTALAKAQRAAITPGNKNVQYYPHYTDIGGFYIPYSIGLSPWGVQALQIILYYGKDPYPQKMKPACFITREHPNIKGYPCAKPIGAWSWLLGRASLPGETVLDPFMGSGTTLIAAKNLNLKAIGVEIEERYCEIAASRCSQEVMVLTA